MCVFHISNQTKKCNFLLLLCFTYFSLLKVTAQKEAYIAPKRDIIILDKHNEELYWVQ
jgi:hypothetical protein